MRGILTATKFEWTSMGVHGEVFQVHGTFCSYCKPRESQKDMQRRRKKNEKIGKIEYVAEAGGEKAQFPPSKPLIAATFPQIEMVQLPEL